MDKLKGIKIVCYSDYWDGPLTGICEYRRRFYWFDVKEFGGWCGPPDEHNDCSYVNREWFVKEIEAWQLAYELYWHCLFETNCGQYQTNFTQTEFVNERYILPEIKSKEYSFLDHGANFYKKRKDEYKEIDYSKNKIIGWFDERIYR